MDSETKKEFISVITDLTFLFSSTDQDSEVSSLITQLLSAYFYNKQNTLVLEQQILSGKPKMEFLSFTDQIKHLMHLMASNKFNRKWRAIVPLIGQIMFLVSTMDLDSELSELISLMKQIISIFNSKPDSESELVSLITRLMRVDTSVDSDTELLSLIRQLATLELETSLIRPVISRFRSLKWEPKQFLSLCPQVKVEGRYKQRKVCPTHVQRRETKKGECRLDFIKYFRLSTGKEHFYCRDCNGENHEEYDKAPTEVKHPLHPKHSLQLAMDFYGGVCYCCDEYLKYISYYCSACDIAMNIACVEKQPLISVHHLKWHEHTLTLFPRHTSLTCDLCAMTDSSCPFYICSPCDFVVHQRCLRLPRVIRISRHPHLISSTLSFAQGDRCCGVCRKKIDNDYGGYSCVKNGCSYGAHSKCATQSNVWDGIDLDGLPEEIEEEALEPFVRISDGIIQHFGHQHHYLKLDENTGRDYDENKQCQACITPIYFGNLYSCPLCDFTLHEECANLSRKIYHPIHPHLLTLVGGYDGDMKYEDECSACRQWCTGGFFYECGKEECGGFKLHVQCATISEPLLHGSHMHPLFLTSKPGEQRECGVCRGGYKETFNCIEDECEFSLCFRCATIPQKMRYKHDKHTLNLCYGRKTCTMAYWCEACEKKIDPTRWFYECDEYCCVTLHIDCLLGRELYMKPGVSLFIEHMKMNVVANNHRMSRPFCSDSDCKKRCPQKVVFKGYSTIFCSTACVYDDYYSSYY